MRQSVEPLSFACIGLLSGEDFDLTVEPADRNAIRQIAIKDKLWASFDGGTCGSWNPAASSRPFDAFTVSCTTLFGPTPHCPRCKSLSRKRTMATRGCNFGPRPLTKKRPSLNRRNIGLRNAQPGLQGQWRPALRRPGNGAWP